MEIIDCPKIASLPEESLEGLSSLRSLSIENCQSLASQPSRMQHATALERLTIMYLFISGIASMGGEPGFTSIFDNLRLPKHQVFARRSPTTPRTPTFVHQRLS
ncbi:hypothetical protein NC652_027163 [Populus alba x Populus x berolinensis]|uniref:Uncharacterized protein n=1 Tax=Populus alba TaxID=43335 RepID=A0A4U5Q1V3_POPAL|nr:hypothetical protein NC652_027163 [Populus alba x Populus x berolinensis]TKS03873.1 hypothetical protein D5086_0000149020 [Populus alba]